MKGMQVSDVGEKIGPLELSSVPLALMRDDESPPVADFIFTMAETDALM
jgi:hypothetical protein